MKTYNRLLALAAALIMTCSCNVVDWFFGPWTLDAPTTCLVDGVRFTSSPEELPRENWPGINLHTGKDWFKFYYSRELKSSDLYAELLFDACVGEAFEIDKEYKCAFWITLSGRDYITTKGTLKFLDYNGDPNSGNVSYVSGVFKFSAETEHGHMVEVAQGTFEEVPVKHYVLHE